MDRHWFVLIFLSTITFLSAFCDGYAVSDVKFCKHESGQSYVSCTGNITDFMSLEQELETLGEPIKVFHLHDATIDTLPSSIFSNQNNHVHTIIFDKVFMKLLRVSVLPCPFESLNETLEKFEVHSSNGLFGWDWAAFSSLKKLHAIIIQNSEVSLIRRTICSASDLRLIQFREANIEFVQPGAFQKCENITYISLSRNRIKKLSRSMFPRPAERLWSIDFSYNELTNLEPDLFENMVSLSELRLDHNQLKHLQYEVFAPIWVNLNQLWLQGNKLTCGSLCWVQDYEHHPLFFDSTFCRQETSMDEKMFYYFDGCIKKNIH